MNQPPWNMDRNLPLATYIVVTRADADQILLVPDGQSWTLPQCTLDPSGIRSARPINNAMAEQFGLQTTVLRCLRHHHDAVAKKQYRVFAVEHHSREAPLPAGARWFGRDELPDLGLSAPEVVSALDAWFASVEDVPDLRTPWALPGWYAVAVAWLQAQLEQRGIATTSPVEQVRSWSLSSLTHVRTDGGAVYFKAVPPFMVQEAAAIQALFEKYPTCVPQPVAVDAERGWMVMFDAGGKLLTETPDVARWQEAVCMHARMQMEQAEHVRDWLELGCPDRSLGKMVELIDPLISVSTQLLAGKPWGLSEDELEQLHGLSMRLKLMCARLATYNVPHTLLHGDLGGNILVKDDGYVFFDWTDVCVSHPFFDMATIMDTVFDDNLFHGEADVAQRLQEAYLEPWTAYEPVERLLDAFHIARPLGALHQAMSYVWILTNLAEDARWELEAALPIWLRGLLNMCSASGSST